MFCVSENTEKIPYVYVNIAAFRIRNVESRKRVGDQSEFSTGVKWIIKHQTVNKKKCRITTHQPAQLLS